MSTSQSTSVRVSREVHRRLKQIAEEEGGTLSEVIERLLEERRRNRFFRQTNEGFAELREDDEEWAAYEREREAVEGASADGLDEFAYDD